MFTLSRCVLFFIALLWPAGAQAFDPTATPEFSLAQGTSYCLGCHDKTPINPLHQSHRVDINYVLAQVRSYGKLKPPALLDPAITLRDDQVVCISCHHPESAHATKLVLSNANSRLCLACHNL